MNKLFGGKLAAALPPDEALRYAQARDKLAACVALYDACDFAGVTRLLVEVADEANAYVAENAPWTLAKSEAQREKLHVVCTLALNYFRLLSVYLAPVVPSIAQRGLALFSCRCGRFRSGRRAVAGRSRSVNSAALATRVDPKQIEAMIEASKESLQPNAPATTPPLSAKPPAGANKNEKAATGKPVAAQAASSPAKSDGFVSIDDFARLDLRIGKVLACEFVDGSDKLLRFELDAGELGKRQIFSGIRASYGEPAKLVGRNVVFIANLAPRKMRFGVSEGMILSAASDGGGAAPGALFLLDADDGAQPGMAVR